MAATIAVCGFLGQVVPALRRAEDKAVRAATVVGGLVGFFFSLAIFGASRLGWECFVFGGTDMTRRQALISFGIGSVLVEVISLGALALLGAGSETIVLVYILLLSL